MKQKCLRCDYEWESDLEKPKTCPRCKSYYWSEERKNANTNNL